MCTTRDLIDCITSRESTEEITRRIIGVDAICDGSRVQVRNLIDFLNKRTSGSRDFFDILSQNRSKGRESYIKKVARSDHYYSLFRKYGILPDDSGIIIEANNLDDLNEIGHELRLLRGNAVEYIDYGVFEKENILNASLEGLPPFLVISIASDNNEILGEVSLRGTQQLQIGKDFHFDTFSHPRLALSFAISKLLEVNHAIYRFRQDIELLEKYIPGNDEIITKFVQEHIAHVIARLKEKLFLLQKKYIDGEKVYTFANTPEGTDELEQIVRRQINQKYVPLI